MSQFSWAIAALLLTLGGIASLSAEEPKFTPQFLQDEQVSSGLFAPE